LGLVASVATCWEKPSGEIVVRRHCPGVVPDQHLKRRMNGVTPA
jgi:hypothetical protein